MSKTPHRGIRTLWDVAYFLEVIYHYRVEFRKLFQQLIKLQFPLSPQKLLDNQIAGGKVDPAALPRKLMTDCVLASTASK